MKRPAAPPPLDIAPALVVAARAQADLHLALCAANGHVDATPACTGLLSLLDDAGTRPSTLAERAGVSRQAMSKLVRQMEERGLLQLVPDPADTRAKVVRTTPRGESLRQQCGVNRAEVDRRVVEALGERGAATFKRQLAAVAARLADEVG